MLLINNQKRIFAEKTGTTYFIVDPTKNNALNIGANVQNNDNNTTMVSSVSLN